MNAHDRQANSGREKEAPREIELKLELASGTAEALLEHPALGRIRPLPDEGGPLHAVYYDTDDHLLHREGISLRIRRKNGRSIQTIKAEQQRHGLAIDRGEWETAVDGELDFAAAAGTPLHVLMSDEKSRKAIRPVFTVETERRAFEIEREGALIEIAVDEAKVSAADRAVAFSEIELELKRGDAAALFTLARDLSRAAPLRLSLTAKSERGYRLLADGATSPFRAEKIKLVKRTSCGEAFQVIARSCLAQMVLNEPLVRQTQNPEALHQMRVGLRRLRAAMSLFKNQLLTDQESATIRDELRWAGQSLGAARDLDVLLERLRSTAEAEHHALPTDDIERQRAEAYRDLMETLDSRRFMEVVLQTAAWIEAGAWTVSDEQVPAKAREHPARDFAASELLRRWKRIRKLSGHLRKLGDEERHELRIRIKKLRYGTEFFASLFTADKARKRRKKLLATLEDLQEQLGELNDLAVSGSLVPSMAALPPERTDQRRKKLLHKAEAASDRLSRAKPFWT